MTRIADTSVLYALFDASDKWHKQARQDVARPEPMVVPREILAETMDLILRKGGHDAALRAFASLVALPVTRIPEETARLEAVRNHFAEANGKLSWADSVVVEFARARAAGLLSYDKEIHRRLKQLR